MLPSLTMDCPTRDEWLYEIKYDGFRGLLEWNKNDCYLWSRNGKDLLPLFPELKSFIIENQEQAKEHLPSSHRW